MWILVTCLRVVNSGVTRCAPGKLGREKIPVGLIELAKDAAEERAENGPNWNLFDCLPANWIHRCRCCGKNMFILKCQSVIILFMLLFSIVLKKEKQNFYIFLYNHFF